MTSNFHFAPETMNISEIFSYYDSPLLFTVLDIYHQMFLGFVIGDDEEGQPDQWLYFPLSPECFNDLISRRIDILGVMERAGNPQVIHVTKGQSGLQSEAILFASVDREILPESGVFLPEVKAKLDCVRFPNLVEYSTKTQVASQSGPSKRSFEGCNAAGSPQSAEDSFARAA